MPYLMRELIRQSRAPIASLARAGSTTALIARDINLFRFEVKGEKLSLLMMCALKLAAMPAAAFVLADCSTCRRSPSCCSIRSIR
ncbi:hypothetical protein [Bradyrhizobium sp. CCGE-LA001]|uniref:hypothetical protein n=1 Tax=Bradyrhizobium sp. CCGE-LA001 TaxID=1223566 RepID=UPI0002DACE46|nr:hypothetical protein [Bradyrhizobium sp. CCGE-LA001]